MDWIALGVGFSISLLFFILACDRIGKLQTSSTKAFTKIGLEFFTARAKIAELEKRCNDLEQALRRFMKDVEVPEEDDPNRPEDLELMLPKRTASGPIFNDGRARK